MKTWIKVTLVILGALVLGFISIVGAVLWTATDIDRAIVENQEKLEIEADTLELTDIKNKGDNIITGKIKNTLDYDISTIEIHFKFYDEDNVVIDDGIALLDEVLVGEVREFEIYIGKEDFKSYVYDIKLYSF